MNGAKTIWYPHYQNKYVYWRQTFLYFIGTNWYKSDRTTYSKIKWITYATTLVIVYTLYDNVIK